MTLQVAMVAAFSLSYPDTPHAWPALTLMASSFNMTKWTLLRCLVPVLALQFAALQLSNLRDSLDSLQAKR